MDFKGQKLAERLYYYIILVLGILGFLLGFIVQDFKVTLAFLGFGTAVSSLICVPDWKYFNQEKLQWLPALEPNSKTKDNNTNTQHTSTQEKKKGKR
jgi:signal peptidase complex subunit 1